MIIPTLTTDRLTLRAPSLEDWEPYASMWADPRVTTFIGGQPRPRDISWGKFTQMIGLWPLLGYGFWTICDPLLGFIGVGGLARFERGIEALEGYPEAGWAFVPEAWGRGIASEALGAIVGWADAQGLGETRCMIGDGNTASIRVAERNGYVRLSDLGGSRIFARRAS